MDLKKTGLKKRVETSKYYLKEVYRLSNNVYSSYSGQTMKVSSGEEYVYFSSCSYLGLHSDNRIIKEISNIDLADMKLLFSAARTRNTSLLEEKINKKLEQIFFSIHCCSISKCTLRPFRGFTFVVIW